MKNIALFLVVGMALVLGWFFLANEKSNVTVDTEETIGTNVFPEQISENEKSSSEQTPERDVAAGLVRFESEELGIGFEYPASWGDVLVEELETGHKNLQFSGFEDPDTSKPASFAAYKFDFYQKLGGGAYWGSFTGDPILDDRCEGCTTETNATGISITSVSSIPFGCDVVGAVEAETYYVPLQNSELHKYLILHDGRVANSYCLSRNENIASGFVSLVNSIEYIE